MESVGLLSIATSCDSVIQEENLGPLSQINSIRSQIYQEIDNAWSTQNVELITEKLNELNSSSLDIKVSDDFFAWNIGFIILRLIEMNNLATNVCIELLTKLLDSKNKEIIDNLVENDIIGTIKILIEQEMDINVRVKGIKLLRLFCVSKIHRSLFFENFSVEMIHSFLEQDESEDLRYETICLLFVIAIDVPKEVYNDILVIINNIYPGSSKRIKNAIIHTLAILFDSLPFSTEFENPETLTTLSATIYENTNFDFSDISSEDKEIATGAVYDMVSISGICTSIFDLPLENVFQVLNVSPAPEFKQRLLHYVFLYISNEEGLTEEEAFQRTTERANEFIERGGESIIQEIMDSGNVKEKTQAINILGSLVSIFDPQKIVEFVKKEWIDEMIDNFEAQNTNKFNTIVILGIIGKVIEAENIAGSTETLDKINESNFMDTVEEWCINSDEACKQYAHMFHDTIQPLLAADVD